MPVSLPEIQSPDGQLRSILQRRLDNLTKPTGSLGRLEEFAREFGVMRGSVDLVLNKQAIFTFAADHGVSRTGVSAYRGDVIASAVVRERKRADSRVVGAGAVMHHRVCADGGVLRACGIEQKRCSASGRIGIPIVENQGSSANTGVEVACTVQKK